MYTAVVALSKCAMAATELFTEQNSSVWPERSAKVSSGDLSGRKRLEPTHFSKS